MIIYFVCKLFLNCYDCVKHIGLPVYEMGYINKPEPEPDSMKRFVNHG